jgi:uncharacterized SAM-binding protein YcdF (DUF218 family)
MSRLRLIAVLGYSEGRTDHLHPICAARVAHAAAIAGDGDVVVLSGWARVNGSRSEATLMSEAWRGAAQRIIVDDAARTTVENALHVARIARRLSPAELVVVTSRWHARRATAAFRWLLRGSGIRVAASSPPERSRRAELRELGLWPLLPGQLARAARRRHNE